MSQCTQKQYPSGCHFKEVPTIEIYSFQYLETLKVFPQYVFVMSMVFFNTQAGGAILVIGLVFLWALIPAVAKLISG